MMPEILWNAFALIGIVCCVVFSIVIFRGVVSSLRDNASANRENAERSLIQQIADASLKPLDEAVSILAKAGMSYDAFVYSRSCRWAIPKIFWRSGKFAAKKAKALDTVMVAAKHYAGDSAPELELHNVLMRQAKKNLLTVIMISCALTRFNQDFKRWFCRD